MKRIAWFCLLIMTLAIIGCQQGTGTKSGGGTTPAPATGGTGTGGSGSGTSGETGK